MQKSLLLQLFLIGILNSVFGSVVKKVELTSSGTLNTLLTSSEKATVTDLILEGNINSDDIYFIRDNMSQLEVLDMTSATIIAGGTNGSANRIPNDAFNPNGSVSTYTLSNNKLRVVKLPFSVKTIGQRSFRCCIALEEVILPYGFSSLESGYQFDRCSALKRIIFPNSMGNILVPSSFTNCTSLDKLYSLRSAGIGIKTSSPNTTFNASGKFTLYIPKGSTTNYTDPTDIPNNTGYSKDWSGAVVTPGGIVESALIVAMSDYNGTISDEGVTLLPSVTSTKTYTFTPKNGYVIDSVTVNGIRVGLGLANTYTITGSGYIVARFKKNSMIEYTKNWTLVTGSISEANMIVALCGPNGTISDYGVNILPVGINSKSFSIIPNVGYEIDSVTVNGKRVVVSNYTYTVDGITSAYIQATFKKSLTTLHPMSFNYYNLYPNPTTGLVYFNTMPQKIYVYSIEGKVLSVLENSTSVNFSGLANGFYFIKFQLEDQMYISKILKK